MASTRVREEEITGGDQWTDPPITPYQASTSVHQNRDGYLNLSIGEGDWVGKITLKRKLPGWTKYESVAEFEESIQTNIFDAEDGVQYIIGCKPGDYTSGTIPVRLSK